MSVRLNADPQVLRTAGNRFHRPRALRLRRFLSASLIATGVGIPALVSADTVEIKVKDVMGPSLDVIHNGEDYTDLSGSYADILVKLHIKLDAGTSGRVKYWSVWPELNGEDIKSVAKSKSYAIGERPKKVDLVESFAIKQADYAKVAVDACNAHANQLRLAGKSNAQIFDSEYTLWINTTAGWQYEMTGVGGIKPPDEATLNPEIEVFCKKVTPVTGQPVAQASVVKTASLEVGTQTSITGECKLQLLGKIETNQANRLVKFRYVDGDGKKSDVKNAQTDSAKTVAFSHDYDLSKNGGQVSGKVRMEGVNTDFVSDWANYEGNCDGATGADDLTTFLPPKATLVSVFIDEEKIVGNRYYCPSRLRIKARLEGRAPVMSGSVVFFAGTASVGAQPFEIALNEKQDLEAVYDLNWDNEAFQSIDPRTVNFKLNVSNESKKLLSEAALTQTFFCKPLISTASVVASVVEEQLVNGAFLCPVKYRMEGTIKAEGPTVAIASLYAGGTKVGGSRKDLKTGQNIKVMSDEVELSWSGVPYTDIGLYQNVPLKLAITNIGNAEIASGSKNQLFKCQKVGGQSSVSPDLPPKAGILETSVMDEVVVAGRHICPAKIRFRGVVEGRGPAEGDTTVLAGNTIARIKLHDLEKGEKQYIAAGHDLDWESALAAGQGTSKTIEFRMNVSDMSKKVVDSVSKKVTYSCKPLIPLASVTATVSKKAMIHGGYLCPVKYKIGGAVKANAPVIVKAYLRAGGQNVAAIPLSLKQGDHRSLMPVERDLSWAGVTQTSGGLLQQLPLQITVKGPGNKKLALGKKSQLFKCLKVGAVGGSSSVGGTESAGQVPKSHQSQQAMLGAKALQQVPGFNLLAPKGVVSKGEVRLSGGKPSGKYKLTFYRKAGSGYKAVKANGLPRKMTGTTAKFKLSALKGGRDWRLEVCPAGTRNKKLCKASNFRLPAFKGATTLKKQ